MSIELNIQRVWQYPDKREHVTIAVETDEKVRQYDVAIASPFGRYLLGLVERERQMVRDKALDNLEQIVTATHGPDAE